MSFSGKTKIKKYTLYHARKNLPTRHNADNKTRGGKALVVAGSAGMRGAAILTATAAARCGAGYVYIHSEKKNLSAQYHPDFLEFDSPKDLKKNPPTAVAVGPGLQTSKSTRLWITTLAQLRFPYVVLDAHALSVLPDLGNKIQLPPTWILTPHEGELGKLLHVSSQKICKDRLRYAQMAQKKWGCTVLLKGYETLALNSEEIWKVQSGTPALAKAGTGDVLTGMILAFLSQGLKSTAAACLAAYIHGKMASDWVQSGHDVISLMASDLLKQLPTSLKKIR